MIKKFIPKKVHIRREPLKFFWLRGFAWLSLLFLTDPHIWGDIDHISDTVWEELDRLIWHEKKENVIILHGGDFVSSEWKHQDRLAFENFAQVAQKLFGKLAGFKHFAVEWNHDQKNTDFPYSKKWLEDKLWVHFMSEPRHAKRIYHDDKCICFHGIETGISYLHTMPKNERNMILDQYIYILNTRSDLNVVLLHHPDGLEYLLKRLKETRTKISTPTIFLAGHTHGAGINIRFIRKIFLTICNTRFKRYKGWYHPEWKYQDTGNWQLYVSTGMGNSPGYNYRINADPEMVLFTL